MNSKRSETVVLILGLASASTVVAQDNGLWSVYDETKFKGGTGGYARYVAICPPDTPIGMTIGSADAPLPKSAKPLHWDTAAGTRVR